MEAIHHLTKNNKYKLRIDLEDWRGIKWFAEYKWVKNKFKNNSFLKYNLFFYSEFSVGHGDGYELNIHGYHGNIKSYSGELGFNALVIFFYKIWITISIKPFAFSLQFWKLEWYEVYYQGQGSGRVAV